MEKERIMEKEKIVFGNSENIEVPYDGIDFQGDCLVVRVTGGDAGELERKFREAGQGGLEVVRQYDGDGNLQATHERYDIFAAVNKRIAETPEKDDVEIVLRRETEVDMKLRHLEEVTDTLLMEQLV